MGKPFVTDQLADEAVTDAKVAAANKDGAVGTPSMRTLGTGAQQAAVGTHVTDVANPHATSLANVGSGTLAELNTAISDATLGIPRQEFIATEVITGTDTALADLLDFTPVSDESVLLFLNSALREQGVGKDYTITGQTITWRASTGTAPDLDTDDTILLVYTRIVPPPPSSTFSVRFDGVNEEVTIASNAAFNMGQHLTISLWLKKQVANEPETETLTERREGVLANAAWSLRKQTDQVTLLLFQGSTQHTMTMVSLPGGNGTDWHHLVMVYDGTLAGGGKDRLTMYWDNVDTDYIFVAPDNNLPSSINDGVGPVHIAQNDIASAPFGDGNIDEFAIFNTSLSVAEVAGLRDGNAPADLFGKTGLVAWLRMGDADTFPTLTDSSGNGHDGTMINMEAGDIVADAPP